MWPVRWKNVIQIKKYLIAGPLPCKMIGLKIMDFIIWWADLREVWYYTHS
jgi:hypothetical protein